MSFMKPVSQQSAIGIAASLTMMGCPSAWFIVPDYLNYPIGQSSPGWIAMTPEELLELREDGWCGEPAAVVMPGEFNEPLILT